ncbi:tetratricopeptide repeat protein [Streptomyces mexicanus]
MYLNNLTSTLGTLFEHTGDIEVLEEAIRVSRKSVAAAPHDHPGHARHLYNLGNILQTLFERTGDIEVLEEAIRVSREAVSATPMTTPTAPCTSTALAASWQTCSRSRAGRKRGRRHAATSARPRAARQVTRSPASRRIGASHSWPPAPTPLGRGWKPWRRPLA